LKSYEAKVYVRQGVARIPHTVQVAAESTFSAQQMLIAQFGSGNIITVPHEISGSSTYNPAPWMDKF